MAMLRIELLGDCETNSGRVVNSLYLDDVYFDGFGLPYIPAWIIRNSFIKQLEDDHSLLTEDEVEALVGVKAQLVIDDALVADRESMRQAILSSRYGEAMLRNPQAVLDSSGFTKVKKTSGLNGGAYERLLAKGTIFEAQLELDTSHISALRRLVEHMTGLFVGHKVYARFTLDEEWGRPRYEVNPPLTSWDGDWIRLKYDLHIISHTTSLDHVTGELGADPYISGRKIRTALASRAELSELFAKTAGGVRCSYAYIEVNGRRGLPIPASYSTKKQDKNDLRDRCSRGRRTDDFDQIKGMGQLFIDDPDNTQIHAMSVRKEQALAHYYQNGSLHAFPFCAIGRGQTCQGFIEGPREDIKRIYESLMKDGNIRIGHLSNLGFGNAYVQVTSIAPIRTAEPTLVEEATVLLASPARLYHNGMYEPSAQNVLSEIQRLVGGNVELEIIRNSQKTCLISTFNSAWGELDPLEYAMQAGSIYRIRAKDRNVFDIAPAMGGVFIGGHADEGFGETYVMPAVDAYYRHITYDDMSEGDFVLTYKVDPNPGRRLLRRLFQTNANALAARMGVMDAESFVCGEFHSGGLGQIKCQVCDDFDREQAFEAYMDALKEAGLNAIRRGCLV